jgi:NADPH-dependent 2,4-dienoyl-CoA reductase/sulfur reductase-like enzyme
VTHSTDIAIVGAGPAGLEAAVAAAEAGAAVTLVDGYPRPGGQYFKQPPETFITDATGDPNHDDEAQKLFQRLADSGATLFSDTLVWGAFPAPGSEHNEGWLLTLHGPETPRRLQASALILATGAFDRPVAFPGWTLPGVFTAGAVQSLLKSQHVLPGRRFVLSGTGPLQVALAAQLLQAGAEVVAVLEGAQPFGWRGIKHARSLWGQWNRLNEGRDYVRTLREAGVPYRTGWSVIEARGEAEVAEAVIARLDNDWRPIDGTAETLVADALVLGYGFIPATQVSRLLGCDHTFEPKRGGWVPERDERLQTSLPGVFAAGDGAGIGGAALARIEGRIAGLAAAQHVGCLSELAATASIAQQQPALAREQRFAAMLGDLFTPGPGLYSLPNDDTVICRCEEVRLSQIREAVTVGAASVNEVKGLTRCGMGNCQGRVCGDLLARSIAGLLDSSNDYAKTLEAIGAFTVRPPLHPLPLSVLAEAAEESSAAYLD